MMMEENKANNVLLALKESQERLNALMARNNKESERRMERFVDQIKGERNKRKHEDEDKRRKNEYRRKHCEKCPPEKNHTHDTAECTADVTCTYCGRKGHYGSDCRQKKQRRGIWKLAQASMLRLLEGQMQARQLPLQSREGTRQRQPRIAHLLPIRAHWPLRQIRLPIRAQKTTLLG